MNWGLEFLQLCWRKVEPASVDCAASRLRDDGLYQEHPPVWLVAPPSVAMTVWRVHRPEKSVITSMPAFIPSAFSRFILPPSRSRMTAFCSSVIVTHCVTSSKVRPHPAVHIPQGRGAIANTRTIRFAHSVLHKKGPKPLLLCRASMPLQCLRYHIVGLF